MIEDKAGILSGVVLGLRRNKSALMRRAVNFAVVEDGFAVAEDEIDIPGDIAVGKILARGNAVLPVRSAVAAAGINRVLVAQQAHIVENGAVAGDQQGQSLRARRKLLDGCG